jgi:hypothetical protein
VTATAGVAALDPRTEIEPYEDAFEAEHGVHAEPVDFVREPHSAP